MVQVVVVSGLVTFCEWSKVGSYSPYQGKGCAVTPNGDLTSCQEYKGA